MSVPLEYKDVVQLIVPSLSADGFATEIISEIEDVPGLFLSTTGYQHGGFQSADVSDAQVYLDPENDFVIDHFNRLEGMLVVANPFGEAEHMAWYRITSVITGQDKLLDNQIDNILCQLKKTKELPYVS